MLRVKVKLNKFMYIFVIDQREVLIHRVSGEK